MCFHGFGDPVDRRVVFFEWRRMKTEDAGGLFESLKSEGAPFLDLAAGEETCNVFFHSPSPSAAVFFSPGRPYEIDLWRSS